MWALEVVNDDAGGLCGAFIRVGYTHIGHALTVTTCPYFCQMS